MCDTSVPHDPGRDEDPSGAPAGSGDYPWIRSPDWPDEETFLSDEDPGELDDYEDPDCSPPPGMDDEQLDALIAEAREITAEQARAAAVAARLGHTAVLAANGSLSAGRRGPGMPGSAKTYPGEYAGPAAGFASGEPLDTAPGCVTLASFLEDAAGDDDRYAGASDDELLGVICAWDRVESHLTACKHAAVAELIRRRPAPKCAAEGPAAMPDSWHEFTARELAPALGLSSGEAEDMLGLAHDLRAAINRAVMEVAPDKARKRREEAARQARIERWAEASGNAGLAGRELPPAQVLAADQRVTWWAKQLRQAGLEGDMDVLRARAYLDILLGIDSRLPAVRSGDPDDPDGPIDPDLARDLAGAAARSDRSTWCVTVTDTQGHAIGHGCAWPAPAARRGKRDGPGGPDPPGGAGFSFMPADQPGPSDGYGTWRFRTGNSGQRDWLIEIGPLPTEDCDHRHEATGHDPGVMLRHLTQVRHATCTGPGCRRPAACCDFEHNVPYEAGGRTCLCNANPKCRFDHRMKQDPRWRAEQLPSGEVRWITPSGRQYTTEPTRYPI